MPVRVRRANRAVLGNGDHVLEARCVAVHGGGRREDNIGYAMGRSGAEEGDSAADVGAVVFERDFGRFADGLYRKLSGLVRDKEGGDGRGETHLEGCKVDYAVDFGVLLENFCHCLTICHVHLVESRTFPAQELHAVKGNNGRVGKIVEDDNIVAVF